MDWKVGDEIEYFYVPRSHHHGEHAKLYKGRIEKVTPEEIAIKWHNTPLKSTEAYSRDAYIVQHMVLASTKKTEDPNFSFRMSKEV